MCNPKTTNDNYNIELPLSIEEKEVNASKRQFSPTFKPYNNLQSFVIFDTGSYSGTSYCARSR